MKLDPTIIEELFKTLVNIDVKGLETYSKIYNKRFGKYCKGTPIKLCFINKEEFYNQNKEVAYILMQTALDFYDEQTDNKILIDELIVSLVFGFIKIITNANEIGKIKKVNDKGFYIEIYLKGKEFL